MWDWVKVFGGCFLFCGALAGCTAEPVVVQDAGRIVELSGGPASISNTAEAVEYFQPQAERLCQARNFSGAQFSGEKEELFILSYLFTCLD